MALAVQVQVYQVLGGLVKSADPTVALRAMRAIRQIVDEVTDPEVQSLVRERSARNRDTTD